MLQAGLLGLLLVGLESQETGRLQHLLGRSGFVTRSTSLTENVVRGAQNVTQAVRAASFSTLHGLWQLCKSRDLQQHSATAVADKATWVGTRAALATRTPC